MAENSITENTQDITSSEGESEVVNKGKEGIILTLNDVREEIDVKIDPIKKDYEKYKSEQSIRLVEFLGIFTAILSFISISGNIIFKVQSVVDIMLLLPMFSLSLILFVVGIKMLIRNENKYGFAIVIAILVILAFGTGIYKLKSPSILSLSTPSTKIGFEKLNAEKLEIK